MVTEREINEIVDLVIEERQLHPVDFMNYAKKLAGQAAYDLHTSDRVLRIPFLAVEKKGKELKAVIEKARDNTDKSYSDTIKKKFAEFAKVYSYAVNHYRKLHGEDKKFNTLKSLADKIDKADKMAKTYTHG